MALDISAQESNIFYIYSLVVICLNNLGLVISGRDLDLSPSTTYKIKTLPIHRHQMNQQVLVLMV